MTTLFAHIGKANCTSVRLTWPNAGTWSARVVLDDDVEVSGQVTLSLGDLDLVAYVVPDHSGQAFLTCSLTLVGGYGGWSKVLPAKAYQSDWGVKAKLVAEDAARECGERLGDFLPSSVDIGAAYVRPEAAASETLTRAAGNNASWWVNPDGSTQVGIRKQQALDKRAYNVVAYDPVERTADLSVDEVSVFPGHVITERLDVPLLVQEVAYQIDGEGLSCKVWGRAPNEASADQTGSLADLLRAVVRANETPEYHGLYRYRVVKMNADRVNLQSASKLRGLPQDIHPVGMMPGLAGAVAQLTEGSQVLLAFIDGDLTQPMIVGFSGNGADSIALCGSTLPAARKTDPVEVTTPMFARFVGNGPLSAGVTYPVSFSSDAAGTMPVTKLTGTITSGSEKVSL